MKRFILLLWNKVYIKDNHNPLVLGLGEDK
jgi:hypothetical protein